jgi:hypothetical protein
MSAAKSQALALSLTLAFATALGGAQAGAPDGRGPPSLALAASDYDWLPRTSRPGVGRLLDRDAAPGILGGARLREAESIYLDEAPKLRIVPLHSPGLSPVASAALEYGLRDRGLVRLDYLAIRPELRRGIDSELALTWYSTVSRGWRWRLGATASRSPEGRDFLVEMGVRLRF